MLLYDTCITCNLATLRILNDLQVCLTHTHRIIYLLHNANTKEGGTHPAVLYPAAPNYVPTIDRLAFLRGVRGLLHLDTGVSELDERLRHRRGGAGVMWVWFKRTRLYIYRKRGTLNTAILSLQCLYNISLSRQFDKEQRIVNRN